ncbi:MAG: LuxR family transcriptional regulator [Alphaproteobacteria bacterium]|nr:LuxR family transcriptional regulator [Alphaproteobacteria bacterium]
MVDNQGIGSALEALSLSQTNLDLDTALTKIFEHYFIERYAFVDVSNDGAEKNIKGFLTTYPKAWLDHYLENKYYNHDPIFLNYGKMQLPFKWDKRTLDGLIPIQKQLFKDAADFNIKLGTTIPLLPRIDGQSFLTILDHANIHPNISYTLTLAAQLYYDRRRIIDANHHINTLTHREKEILQMKSRGQSIKIIAYNLGVSDSTIIFHLRNIRQKLKATSLAHALFLFGLATAHGLIQNQE